MNIGLGYNANHRRSSDMKTYVFVIKNIRQYKVSFRKALIRISTSTKILWDLRIRNEKET